MTKETVLVFRVGHLGDSLVALPALQVLRHRFPQSPFKLITSRPAEASFVPAWEVFRYTGAFDEVLEYSVGSLFSQLGLAARIRALRGSKILAYLAPVRTERQLKRDRFFFRRVCGVERILGMRGGLQPSLRSTDGSLRVLEPEWARLRSVVDSSPETSPSVISGPLLRPPPKAIDKANRLLSRFDAGDQLFALAPGSKMAAKRWFLDRYVEIARRIVGRSSLARIVIVGGSEDHQLGEEIVDAIGLAAGINLAGKTNIIESAAVLERCDMYLGNDTGTMHLAAAVGLRCVALFASRDNPGLWEPFGSGHTILRRDLECSGCMLTECVVQRMRCLELISVDDVWASIERNAAR